MVTGAVGGVTTGVSARDRATTIKVAIADDAQPADLLRPGHINPLRAREGGVLVRAGQTEGSVDLARLAGLKPAAVICENPKVFGYDGFCPVCAAPGQPAPAPAAAPASKHS